MQFLVNFIGAKIKQNNLIYFEGIPLMLITLNELGKFLYKTINEFMAMLNKRWKALAKRRKWRQKSENEFWDNESARDEEELEKGMRGNHLPGQRSPTEEMKAVSFNLYVSVQTVVDKATIYRNRDQICLQKCKGCRGGL